MTADDELRLHGIREMHENDCIARGVHDPTTCARTMFAIAEPACPDVDEHLLLKLLDEARSSNARSVASDDK